MSVLIDIAYKVSPEEYKFPFLIMSKEGVSRIFGIESIKMSARSVAILEPLYNYMKYYYELMVANVEEYIKSKLLKFDVRERELLDLIFVDSVKANQDRRHLFNYIRKDLTISVPEPTTKSVSTQYTLTDFFNVTINTILYEGQITKNDTDEDKKKKIQLINLYSNTFIDDISYLYYIIYPELVPYKKDIDLIKVATVDEPELLKSLISEKKNELIVENIVKQAGGESSEDNEYIEGGISIKTTSQKFGEEVTDAVNTFFGINLRGITELGYSTTEISDDNHKIRKLKNIEDSIRIINGLNKLESFIYYGYMFLSNNINVTEKISDGTGPTLQKLHKFFSNIPTLLYKDATGNYSPLSNTGYIQAYLRAWLLYTYMLYVNGLLVGIIPILQKMSGYDLLELPRFLMKQDRMRFKELRLMFSKGVQGINLNAKNENEVWPCRTYYDELFVAFKTAINMQTKYTNIDNLFIDTNGKTLRRWCEDSMTILVSTMTAKSLEGYNTLDKLYNKLDKLVNTKIYEIEFKNATTTYSQIYQHYQQNAMMMAVEKYNNYMRYTIVKTYENFRDILYAYSSESSNQTGGGEELEIGRRELLQSIHLFNTPFYRIGNPSPDVASKFRVPIPEKVNVVVAIAEKVESKVISPADVAISFNKNGTEEINLQITLQENGQDA
jgi:hypothetical protein